MRRKRRKRISRPAAFPGGGRVLRRKLASTGGFSLAETLFCCLILALSSVTLIQTMRLAGEQFNTRTRESDARILCNTLSQAVQEYLSCATPNPLESGGGVSAFVTGAIPSREEAVPFSFTVTGEGYLALEYPPEGSDTGVLLLAPAADYEMHEGRATLAASCTVDYVSDGGYFSVSVRVYPNPLGPRWEAEMQEVQNDFVVIPIQPLPEGA